ncbi:MAG: HIT domain-containing protein [Deltaproteobacteria bacterium]|nr:HIT domain-containing protein [Deltaproteobacteria bacterium]
MERLWAPWRMQYLENAAPSGCFFCAAVAGDDETSLLVVARDAHAVTMLNKFPYGHGHLLVAPREHVALPEDLADPAYAGLMRAVRRAARALWAAFAPEGMNVGMNLGRAAGAGVADHCHWHLLPRWNGDTNFMPVIGDVKVMSEHLEATLARIRAHYA